MRTTTVRFLIVNAIFATIGGMSFSAERAPQSTLVEQPDYRPPEADTPGNPYQAPGNAVIASKAPLLWRWQLEQPDGTGLAIGGLAFRNEDPVPPTTVKRDGAWVDIRADLRKKNPLQSLHDRLQVLHPTFKTVFSRSRYIYLEGRAEADERSYLEKSVAPLVRDFLEKAKALRAELAKVDAGDRYIKGQADLAAGYLDLACPLLEAMGLRTSHEKFVALRLARVNLERAIDALDAEPPARVLSMLAFDAKTGLYVIFGGDHFDYLSNDLWVFDPKKQRWEERHPKLAPEPRGNHYLVGNGDGTISLRSGYVYVPSPRPKGYVAYTYTSVGLTSYMYDLATDTWSGPSDPPMSAPDTRNYRVGPNLPDAYTVEPRPDAAAHEKLLASIPVNTWVELKPPIKFYGERSWGTMPIDPDRDLIYCFNGGHSIWPGADVVSYHLATNRWDQPVETETSLGFIGSGYLPGWNFNRRAWICGHSYNTYAYHPGLRKLVLNGRVTWTTGCPDQNSYVYDPDYGDWSQRVQTPRGFDYHAAMVRYAPGLGMITWYGGDLWKLDDATLKWEKLSLKGKLTSVVGDHAGLVYDSKRSRMLFFTGGGYNGPAYSGEVCAVSIPSLEVTTFTPKGSEFIGQLTPVGKNRDTETVWAKRDIAYSPTLDLFLFLSKLPGGYTAAYDGKNDRWVGLKLPGKWASGGTSGSLQYDAKRDLFYSISAWGDVSVLRLDPQTLEVKTLEEIGALNK